MLILKPSKERFLPVSMRNINGSKNINGEKKKIEVNSGSYESLAFSILVREIFLY